MPIQRFSLMLVVLMTTCFFTSVAPVMAHHSHAMFDSDQEITITGKVAGLRYANPHVRLLLEVESEAGEIERWDIEMSTIVNMRERGVTRATFPSGAEVNNYNKSLTGWRTCWKLFPLTFCGRCPQYGRGQQLGSFFLKKQEVAENIGDFLQD